MKGEGKIEGVAPTFSRIQIPYLSPKYLLKCLPWVNVESGIYRINKLKVGEGEGRKIASGQKKGIGHKEDYYFLSDLLKSIPLFSHIPDEPLKDILKGMYEKRVEPERVIVKQNEKGEEFYIITEGTFEVSVEGRKGKKLILKTLSEGDYFGEMALLGNSFRQATITAATRGSLIVLNKETFDKIIGNSELRKALEKVFEQRKKELALSGQSDVGVPLLSCPKGKRIVPKGVIECEPDPAELHLNLIQTILSINSEAKDLYGSSYLCGLSERLNVVIETILEKEEWEIINNPNFGLLNSVSPDMTLETKSGPPGPDDLDALLSLVWNRPSFFLAHPKAIEAFRAECSYRGIYPPDMKAFGENFTSWRGLPLIPSDKIPITGEKGVPTTHMLLIRAGEEEQGVIGLHKKKVETIIETEVPSLSIQALGLNDSSTENYLVTKYFSVAILTENALGALKNIELGAYSRK